MAAKKVDTRRSPRRVFSRGLGVLHQGVFEVAQALQLSETGMAFVSPSTYPVGAQVIVTMTVLGRSGLVLRAEVVSERQPVGKMKSYGVEFRTLDLHQRRLIRSYVAAKTQAEAEAEDI